MSECNVCGKTTTIDRPRSTDWETLRVEWNDDDSMEICPECQDALLYVAKRKTLLEAIAKVVADATAYDEE